MKIAIDLRPLQIGHQNRGIGSYLLNILTRIPNDRKDISFICIRYSSSNPIKDYNLLIDQEYEELVINKHPFVFTFTGVLRHVWSSFTPRFIKLHKFHPDVFLQTDYLLGAPRIRGCSIAVVSYDLIPLIFKSAYLPRWQKFALNEQLGIRLRIRQSLRAAFYRNRYKRGLNLLKRADSVISISKSTTDDLVKIAGIDKKMITTIPLAPSFRNEGLSEPRREIKDLIGKMPGDYACFIGGTDKRRQAHELVHAHNLLNARGVDLSLVFIGGEFDEKQSELNPITKSAIHTSSYRNKIHMVGKVSEADKLFILQNATAFVYPTIYEGFGLPILEAMHAKCPVITYNNSSIKEIAGDAAVYAVPEDGLGISKALENIISSKTLSTSIQKKGLKQVGRYSWDKTFKQTWRKLTSM